MIVGSGRFGFGRRHHVSQFAGFFASLLCFVFLACGGAGDSSASDAEQPDPPAQLEPSSERDVAVPTLPAGFTEADYEEGREAYHGPGLCFSCHAPNGRGGFLGPDLTDGEWFNISRSVDEIAGIIAGGVSEPFDYPEPMPAMGGSELGAQAIRNLALYVWTLSAEAADAGSTDGPQATRPSGDAP